MERGGGGESKQRLALQGLSCAARKTFLHFRSRSCWWVCCSHIHITVQQTLSLKSDSGLRDVFTAQELRNIQYRPNQNDTDILYVVKIYRNLVI
jgi:hypothetical protein